MLLHLETGVVLADPVREGHSVWGRTLSVIRASHEAKEHRCMEEGTGARQLSAEGHPGWRQGWQPEQRRRPCHCGLGEEVSPPTPTAAGAQLQDVTASVSVLLSLRVSDTVSRQLWDVTLLPKKTFITELIQTHERTLGQGARHHQENSGRVRVTVMLGWRRRL